MAERESLFSDGRRYRIAWFQGDAQRPEDHYQPYVSQDEIMARAQRHSGHPETPLLRLLLVPEDTDLTTLGGDDWDDAPADCNASEPYDPPEGSVWVELRLGDAWPT
jgi:hypothetical protein